MAVKEFYDNHIHRYIGDSDSPATFYDKARKAGAIGGNILSLPPRSFEQDQSLTYQNRIEDILDFCDGLEGFRPFFWIDPTEENAVEQVDYAAKAGIKGFKVLCSNHYPCDGLKAYFAIAKHNLPLLFHSGVLWDGKISSEFNRPMAFEGLMQVNSLRFALAHVSWPWYDECIALFGKLLSASRGDYNEPVTCQNSMFIDTTPGTPFIYREEVFEKIYMIDYNLKERVIFGTDNNVNSFDIDNAVRWVEWDYATIKKIRESADNRIPLPHNLPSTDEIFRKATQENYLKFVGQD